MGVKVYFCGDDYDSSAVKRLKTALKEADTAIENLWKALESGQSVEMITERSEKRKKEKEELQAQIAIEMNKQIVFTAHKSELSCMHSKRAASTMKTTGAASSISSYGRFICMMTA